MSCLPPPAAGHRDKLCLSLPTSSPKRGWPQDSYAAGTSASHSISAASKPVFIAIRVTRRHPLQTCKVIFHQTWSITRVALISQFFLCSSSPWVSSCLPTLLLPLYRPLIIVHQTTIRDCALHVRIAPHKHLLLRKAGGSTAGTAGNPLGGTSTACSSTRALPVAVSPSTLLTPLRGEQINKEQLWQSNQMMATKTGPCFAR